MPVPVTKPPTVSIGFIGVVPMSTGRPVIGCCAICFCTMLLTFLPLTYIVLPTLTGL